MQKVLFGMVVALGLVACQNNLASSEAGTLAAGPQLTCSDNPENGRFVSLTRSGNLLKVLDSWGLVNGPEFRQNYKLSKVMIFAEPAGKPDVECRSEGQITMKVWLKNRYANIGSEYFKMVETDEVLSQPVVNTNPQPQPAPAKRPECSKEIFSGMTQVIKLEDKKTLSVKVLSLVNGGSSDLYTLSPVTLFVEPTGTPSLECQSDNLNIKMWEKVALINDAYYRLKLEQHTENL